MVVVAIIPLNYFLVRIGFSNLTSIKIGSQTYIIVEVWGVNFLWFEYLISTTIIVSKRVEF